MAEYRQKTKQYIINASKQPIYILRDDYILFNLNACFVKPNNFTRFESLIREAKLKGGTKLNLGNFASLCYKLGIDYRSQEAFDFISRIIGIAKSSSIKITQDNIKMYGEVDLQPIETLITYDRKSNVIYTNSVLVECLKILGYVDSQIREIIDYTKDFRTVIPEDLIDELPIKNSLTKETYKKIQELI